MRQREFIAFVGSTAVAWPLMARAQQPAMPVVGFLDPRSPDAMADRLRAFRLGLKDVGYVEGENVTIIYRFAEDQNDRLPELAAELVRRQVTVIAASATPAAPAAKAATTTIPIAFVVAQDPVRMGLVASLARPGGNMTGINFFGGELAAKRLELLHELLPRAVRVAVFVNPADATNTASTLRDVEAAARAIGLQVQVLNASTSGEINAAFENVGRDRPDALFVGANTFLNARRIQVVQLAAFHRLLAVYPTRDFVEVGGLTSYGASVVDAHRQMGGYTGRILKGAKPADLPVVQSSKFDLVINAETARMLSLAVPPSLLARVDEVIE
jgi:putative tryptophan/tyrosine transport system substrate-binding protein